MIVLGLETSCDETAAAVVADDGTVLADEILSQLKEHAPYGGIVPEIAARSHVVHLDGVIDRAMRRAEVDFAGLDGVAATAGPGLIGGLMVGLTAGKAIASVTRKPFLAINHLEGHALSPRLVAPLAFPYLLLLISGGHCQLLIVEGVGRYRRLGTTVDDAVGEAFDKTAKLLGLGYPGGPAVERAAADGDAERAARFELPRPMLGRAGADFSFSGLKTAVRHAVTSLGPAPENSERAALARAFQEAVADCLVDRTANAIRLARATHASLSHLVVAGGVAANATLKARLRALAEDEGVTLVVPPARLCTDNGAMIAWAGIERLRLGLRDTLDVGPRARWPLDSKAPPAPGAGVKA